MATTAMLLLLCTLLLQPQPSVLSPLVNIVKLNEVKLNESVMNVLEENNEPVLKVEMVEVGNSLKTRLLEIIEKIKNLPILRKIFEFISKPKEPENGELPEESEIEGLSNSLKKKVEKVVSILKDLPFIKNFFEADDEELGEELEAALKMIGKDFDIESLLNKFDNASDLFSFEELLEFVDNTLDTIVGSDILNSIVNGLITDVAEELPIETIEETLALVPWATLEESLRDLDSLNIEKLQEILLSFEDLFKHIINLVTSHEDEIVDAVGEAISGEAELNEEEMADIGRKAEFLLKNVADVMTEKNLRHFTLHLTNHITKALNSVPSPRCSDARTTTPMKVVCYYPNWVYYRKGDGKYTVDDIDTSLCTHIIYSFVILDGEKHIIKAHDTWLDIDLGNFRKFTALKKTNPNAKYMLALGGWNDSKMPKYSELLASPSKIDNFVREAVVFLKEYGFDGLDLDYEYPSYDGHGRDAPDSDKPGFTLLCKKLSEAFKADSFELTAAVSASQSVISNAYDIPEISKYLDAIHMMSYDLHGSWEKMVNHQSPLFGADWDPLTTDYGANYWVAQGCPKHKLIVGIPTYGRSWTLGSGYDSTEWEYEINSTAKGPGEAGPLTKAKGFLAYNEICQFVKNDGWTKVSDPTNKMGPYAYKGSQWVGYDDPAIARVKAKYILKNQFGGAMFWDLPSDDFKNLCGEGRYPIIGAVSGILKGQSVRSCGLETQNIAELMTNKNLRMGRQL